VEKLTRTETWRQEASTPLSSYPFSLLRIRLEIPSVHLMTITRARLLTQLNRCQGFKLTLVSAPTGFGKTTLLSKWANQNSLAVAWISLSESDNDLEHFWACVVNALTSLATDTDAREPEILALNSPESIVAAMTNLASALAQEFALVLDNYHIIQNPQIHLVLTRLLDYLPKQMHILISSRSRPRLPLARLRACRQLNELGPEDLLFTQEEIKTFFSRTLGENLSSSQASTIKACTDGWAAILQLVAIWLQKQKDGWEALTRISESHHYIHDYLATEVLQQQPRALQLFLLQTSILEQFDSSLCNAVTGQTHAQMMLEEIERANFLIASPNNQQNWYGYRQVFRTVLRERLGQVLPNLVPILYRRACAWYEQQKRFDEAIAYALAGRDFEKAAELILKIGEKMLVSGETSTLLAWLKALPEELTCLYPLLCLFYAWCLMMAGQFDAAETWIRNIDYLDKQVSFFPETQVQPPLAQKENDTRSTRESTIAVLRAHIAIFWGDISHVADFTLQAQTSLSGENAFVQSLNMLNVGVVNWLEGNILSSEEAFTAAAMQGKRLNNTYIMLAAACGLTLTNMLREKYRRAFAIAQHALQTIMHQKNDLSPFSAYLYTETSYLLYGWNRLDEAAHYAREALEYGEKQNRDILIYGYTILSRIMLAKGNLDEAEKLLRQAEGNLPYSQHRPWIVSRMAGHHVRLALACNDLQRAEFWSRVPDLQYFGSSATILRMRVLLARKQPCEVLKLAQENGAQNKEIRLLILQARSYQELGELSNALQTLDKIVQIAEPEGYVRLFLDEGPSFAQLLRAQLERYDKQDKSHYTRFIRYIRLLLTEFAKEAPASSASPERSTRFSTPVEMIDELSERELDVLRGILAGLSNQEIAQQIVVAESTVKWHIKNIYSKLRVHNRAQAIIEARRLQLWS
jgi:LuxR family maltose regulon positive regulatory protein